ncbi:MAG: DDE-type integrase/transposase/recombinase [Chloroflexi bacterium]|nr:MAG: DDE-type integrase/transposase/recombinase [Chloroflexota bacterium]
MRQPEGTTQASQRGVTKKEEKIAVEEISHKEMKKELAKGESVYACFLKENLTNDIPDQRTEKDISKLPKEYQYYAKLFEKETGSSALPAHQPWDHEIPLMEGKQPTFGPIYSCSEKELEALREYLRENLEKGFIRPSTSPAEYPILFVPKKNGKLRLCVDYRQLNSITIKNRYPLPRIDELMDRVHGAKWFTKFDLQGAYNLIRMKEGEEWKTAFRTRYGHYEYCVMPFGLTNAPASFQSLINNALREYLDKICVVYLDDILIYSKTKKEHKRHVKLILQALKRWNLKIDLDKSQFHKEEVEFLGHIIGVNGIRIDPRKVKAILEWPQPKTLSELQQFLGLANYYRRFIKHYSKRAAPLHRYTNKGVPFIWNEEAEEAFQLLKKAFTEAPVLMIFDPEKEIYMGTDASDYASGAHISQKDDQGKLHPVAFMSRKFSPAELNYQIYDKELLAIVVACEEWRVYLEGAKFPITVYTDHENLVYFTTTKKLNRRQVRWWETLSSLDLKILHRPGRENTQADALSHRPDHLEGVKPVSHAILRQDGEVFIINQHAFATFTLTSDKELEAEIITAYENDTMAKAIKEKTPEQFQVTPEGLILFKNLIYVAGDKLRKQILHDHHDTPGSGHQGVEKTLDRISQSYYWPGLRRTVEKYVDTCDLCWKSRAQRHLPYGQLHPMPTPDRPWETIAWDFIVKLPKSREPLTGAIYDSIWVIADKLTKFAYFIPYKESSGPEDLAYMFARIIYSSHGLPKNIITDRAGLFMDKFWQTFTAKMGTKSKMSSAYHPETDGQVERMNQTLEQYLRCFVNGKQNDWVRYLPMAQYAYNSSRHTVTGITPFYANYGKEAPAFHQPFESTRWEQRASLDVEKLKALHKDLQNEIEFLNQRMAYYYNQHHGKEPNLKEGDEVYLLRKNIATKRPSDKLDYRKLGPFPITKKINDVTYRLKLPEGTKLLPTFHVSLLEPAPKGLRKSTTIEPEIEAIEEDEPEWEVQKILESKYENGALHYLVHWKGYDDDNDSWEPAEYLNCDKLIRKFHRQNPNAAR